MANERAEVFSTAVAWSELTTRQARTRITRAIDNLNSPEWGDIAMEGAIEDLQAAVDLLKESREEGWRKV